jgi:hypothetical protein
VSEENTQREDRLIETGLSVQDAQGEDSFQLIINRSNNQLTIKDSSTGREIKIKANIVDEEEEADESELDELIKPLNAEEFQLVLQKLNELGVSWTADYPPRIKPPKNPDKSFYEEFSKIQKEYPLFPHILGSVIFHALTGRVPSFPFVNDEELGKKALALNGFITDDFRSEFFFKYAIKVPYFENLDWEVVVKTYEKNVDHMPRIAYAILSLIFRKPVDSTRPLEDVTNEPNAPDFFTVAVNEYLVDRLLATLTDVKNALNKAQRVANVLDETSLKEKEADTNGTDNPK